MKAALWIAAAVAICPPALLTSHAQTNSSSGSPQLPAPIHVSNTFHFQVNSPLVQAAPLFGPEGERSWAGKHWNPVFLYPQPGENTILDRQGAVFTIQRGPYTSVWVTTVYDPAAGRMQYVALIPGHMVSVIDVRLTPTSPKTVGVEVTYARTALDPAANEEVIAHGSADRESGREWQDAIEASLKDQRRKTP